MKKLFLISAILGFYLLVGQVTEKYEMIPKEAIRIRVIGNSNTKIDQEEKKKVKEVLENYYYPKLQEVKGIEEARTTIQSSIPEVESLVKQTFPQTEFTINFGKNYFPEKEYKGVLYEEGLYESLVVTLGEGEGKNWWCVLFPPLCLLENETGEEVEYRSFVKDMIDKYF